MKPKCWGVGLGRTATKSLISALKILGYENAIHNPGYFEELQKVDAAAEAGCQVFYKYLDARYPDSKFILTTRDLRSWLRSNKKAFDIYPMDRINTDSPFCDAMIRNRMARWNTLEYDKQTLIEKYYRHHLDVVQHFSTRPEKLLIMDIINGDGWELLCSFLAVPVPDILFPHLVD